MGMTSNNDVNIDNITALEGNILIDAANVNFLNPSFDIVNMTISANEVTINANNADITLTGGDTVVNVNIAGDMTINKTTTGSLTIYSSNNLKLNGLKVIDAVAIIS